MSNIPTPASIDEAPEASRAILDGLQKQIGRVPNIFRIVSNSPAALQGLVQLRSALSKGALSGATQERIALTMAEANGCDYCLAAHSYSGKHFAKLDEIEIAANRHGTSSEPKAAAAVAFARLLTDKRGAVSPVEVDAVRGAGVSDAEIVEIVAHVALNTFTNYVNKALGTEIDFPRADRAAA